MREDWREELGNGCTSYCSVITEHHDQSNFQKKAWRGYQFHSLGICDTRAKTRWQEQLRAHVLIREQKAERHWE